MVAKVIVDISTNEVDKSFDYNIPQGLEIRAGDRVIVPFGRNTAEGFCIAVTENSEYDKLKDIISACDAYTAVTPEMLALMEYMRKQFFLRYADILRLFIPTGLRGGRVKEATKFYISLNQSVTYQPKANAKKQLELLEQLKVCKVMGFTEACNAFSASAVNALIEKQAVIKSGEELLRQPFQDIKIQNKKNQLKVFQEEAVDKIFSTQKSTILLHGVTGSGKTEIYMSCIEKTLKAGKNAIMLVPEISLTPQVLKLFRGRFGDDVAMLHSGLSDGERFDEWRKLLLGKARIAVGARSAIFAPLENLGVIIIDEEHDSSYVSESNPRYVTSEIAYFRANYNGAKLIMGSATPSVESYKKAKENQYELITLSQRVNDLEMPKIEIVDMAMELRNGNEGLFSVEMQKALADVLKKNEQAMLFINRRGYASFVMCRECGYIAKCSDCDVSLAYHSEENLLKCHYCGKTFKMLTNCPMCNGTKLRNGRVGTERVVADLKSLFPQVKTLRMDNDTTTTKTAYLDILEAFSEHKADVLVGTQMIAKGHDFADVTLVGILDADMSLYFSDYRSSERTFQLITQVAGRAGRSKKVGRVILQTYSPRHYVYRFAQNYDYKGFIAKETNTREVTQFPPFTRILRVLVSSATEEKAVDCAKVIYNKIKKLKADNPDAFVYMQAMKAPIKRIQNKFRYQVIMRLNRNHEEQILKAVHDIVDSSRVKDVWTFIESNPQNLN